MKNLIGSINLHVGVFKIEEQWHSGNVMIDNLFYQIGRINFYLFIQIQLL